MNPRTLLTDTTPGPWEAEPGTDGAPYFDVFVSRINERGERRGWFYIAENMTPANARLAAAAPDLAARVIALEDEIKDLEDEIKDLIAGAHGGWVEVPAADLRALLDGEAGEWREKGAFDA